MERFAHAHEDNVPQATVLSGKQLSGLQHLVAKAMADGQSTIKAVQLEEVPPPDEIVDSIY